MIIRCVSALLFYLQHQRAETSKGNYSLIQTQCLSAVSTARKVIAFLFSVEDLAERDNDGRRLFCFQVKILVPNSTAGMVIGKGGNYIKQIKEETGAYVQISQKAKDQTLAERCITVIGEYGPAGALEPLLSLQPPLPPWPHVDSRDGPAGRLPFNPLRSRCRRSSDGFRGCRLCRPPDRGEFRRGRGCTGRRRLLRGGRQAAAAAAAAGVPTAAAATTAGC